MVLNSAHSMLQLLVYFSAKSGSSPNSCFVTVSVYTTQGITPRHVMFSYGVSFVVFTIPVVPGLFQRDMEQGSDHLRCGSRQ